MPPRSAPGCSASRARAGTGDGRGRPPDRPRRPCGR